MIKIFISYADEDVSAATRLWEKLDSYPGVDAWFDKKSLLPGDAWKHNIEKAMGEADYVLVLLSSISVGKKGYFQREVRLAIEILDNDVPENKVFIIPVRLDDCEIHFKRLGDNQRIDMFPIWEDGIGELQKLIGAHRRSGIPNDGSIRLCTHQARFNSAPEIYYFVTVTNLSNKEPIEVTHVWYEDIDTHIPVLVQDRPLPKRLEPQEIWETFLLKKDLPEYLQNDAYLSFRIRTSSGKIYSSIKDGSVPPYGSVPGGLLNLNAQD